MSKDAATPRVFLIRHGATEWSLSGKYTGMTDLPLLPEGEEAIRSTARVVFGPGKLVDPLKLARVYVSPRQRATRTLGLLLYATPEEYRREVHRRMVVTEDVREWSYGEYEGMLTGEIRKYRREKGLDDSERKEGRQWDLWQDGATGEGAEGPEDVQRRVDSVIREVVDLQRPWLKEGEEEKGKGLEEGERKDVLVVAHGHILRAFVKRWLTLEMGSNVELMLEPGGVCGLSYAHHSERERAVMVGMSFPGC